MKDETIGLSATLLASGNRVAQGDIDIVPCDDIPTGLEKSAAESGLLILAHSESGHHHALAYSQDVDIYDQDEYVSYVNNRSDNVIELRHYKSGPDRHKSIGIPPGVHKVIRGREYTPEGYRRAAD